MRGIVDQYLSRCYFKPKIILETENTVTTPGYGPGGMGIVICPQLFLRTIQLPGVKPAPEDVDLFPLADPSTLSRLVVATAGTGICPTSLSASSSSPRTC